MKGADGVAAPAHAGYHVVGKSPFGIQYLNSRLATYDRLEVPHHHGVGVGPHSAAQEVMRGLHVGHPVPYGLVDRVLEGPAPRLHLADLGPQQPHPEHVERLAHDVVGAHVDHAREPHHGAYRGRGDAMLSSACLGYDALLAHAFGQQRLAQSIVDLVGAGMGQVLPLQVYLGPAGLPCEIGGVVKCCGPPGVGGIQSLQLTLEPRVPLEATVGAFQLFQSGHQGLGHEPATERPEMASLVGQGRGIYHIEPPLGHCA